MINRAKQLADIRAEGAPAFRLEMNFKAFREDGSALEGTYTETWISKNQWRRKILVGDFSKDEVSADGTRWLLETGKTLPETTHNLSALSNLGRLRPESWRPEKISSRKLGASDVRCIETLGELHPGAPILREHANDGEMPALCFDANNGLLTAEIEPVFVVDHSVNTGCFFYDYEKFGDRTVAKSYQCMKPGHPTIEAKVVELIAEPKVDPTIFTLANAVREPKNCPDPIKPPKVVHEGVVIPRGTGVITVSAVIGIDGVPRDLAAVNAAFQGVREAALETVSQWRFRAATC